MRFGDIACFNGFADLRCRTEVRPTFNTVPKAAHETTSRHSTTLVLIVLIAFEALVNSARSPVILACR